MNNVRRIAAAAGFAAFGLVSSSAIAAQCAGFQDMDDQNPVTAPFCNNVEWIRNRGVTLGCGPTPGVIYCPGDFVNRLQMAAFMNRLGTALTPTVLQVNATKAVVGPPLFDLDIAGLGSGLRAPAATLCQTQPYTVQGYPRQATIKADFSGAADGPVQMFGIPVVSTDNGATFQDAVTFGMRASIGTMANPAWEYAWQSMAQTVTLDLAVGNSYVFGYYVGRAAEDLIAGGTEDLENWRCSLTVEIRSRDGTTSPF